MTMNKIAKLEHGIFFVQEMPSKELLNLSKQHRRKMGLSLFHQ